MLTLRSNHIADFLEVREYLNKILQDTEKHLIIGYACGPLNLVDLKQSPFPDLSFRFNLEFIFREDATPEDLNKEVRPFEDNKIPSCSPDSILKAINLITVNREIIGNEKPSLIYISSETSILNISQSGRNQYTVSLVVNSIPADAFDNISRLPVNPDTLQGIVNIKEERNAEEKEIRH